MSTSNKNLREDIMSDLRRSIEDSFLERIDEIEEDSQIFQQYVREILAIHKNQKKYLVSFNEFHNKLLRKENTNKQEAQEYYEHYRGKQLSSRVNTIKESFTNELETIFNLFPLPETIYAEKVKEVWEAELQRKLQQRNPQLPRVYFNDFSDIIDRVFFGFQEKLTILYDSKENSRTNNLLEASKQTGKLFFTPSEKQILHKKTEAEFTSGEEKLKQQFFQEVEGRLPLYMTHPTISDIHLQLLVSHEEYINTPQIADKLSNLYAQTVEKLDSSSKGKKELDLWVTEEARKIMRLEMYKALKVQSSELREFPLYFKVKADAIFTSKINSISEHNLQKFGKHHQEISDLVREYIRKIQLICLDLNKELSNHITQETSDKEIEKLLEKYEQKVEYQKSKQEIQLNAQVLNVMHPEKKYYIPTYSSTYIFDLQGYVFGKYEGLLDKNIQDYLSTVYEEYSYIFENLLEKFNKKEEELIDEHYGTDVYKGLLSELNTDFSRVVGEKYMEARNSIDNYFQKGTVSK